MKKRMPLWGAGLLLVGCVPPHATTPAAAPTPSSQDHAQAACEQWLSAIVDTPDDLPWPELSRLIDQAGITAAQAGEDYLPLLNHLAALSIGLEIGSIDAFNKNMDALLTICDPLLAEYK